MKYFRWLMILLVVGLLSIVVYWFARFYFLRLAEYRQFQKSYLKLMLETDHQELYFTCKRLIKDFPDYKWVYIGNGEYYCIGFKKQVELPKIIKNIEPRAVMSLGDYIYISLLKGGGIFDTTDNDAGFWVYLNDSDLKDANGFANTSEHPSYHKKIEPGIFYVDSNFPKARKLRTHLQLNLEKERKKISNEK